MSSRRDQLEPETAANRGPRALATRPMILVLFASFFTMVGFYLLLSVVPLYAAERGGGNSGAGSATAVFMLSTVLAQLGMPRVLARFGYRAVLAAGLLLVGLPAFLYGPLGGVPAILAVTLVRGAGFGAAIVALAALVTELAPPGRRGEALGLYGVALTLPTVFCGALGLWIVERSGFALVFVVGALAPLLAASAALGVSEPDRREQEGAGLLRTLFERTSLLRIFLLFTSCTAVSGVVVTFLPLSAPGPGLFSAATALLLLGVSATFFRWWAGRLGDRRDPRVLLVPGLLCAALGMAVLSLEGLALLGGALLFGAGFGMLQNTTLLLTMQRVPKSEYGLGSTLWNLAFDAGTGAGAFVFGFVVGAAGFSWTYVLCAVLLVATTALVPGTGPEKLSQP
ncbi:MAG TPA: MFS transporter [Rubrobacteraceae bacterium]|nr:MFS transporter [Rubrobacteraceae bacterium]